LGGKSSKTRRPWKGQGHSPQTDGGFQIEGDAAPAPCGPGVVDQEEPLRKGRGKPRPRLRSILPGQEKRRGPREGIRDQNVKNAPFPQLWKKRKINERSILSPKTKRMASEKPATVQRFKRRVPGMRLVSRPVSELEEASHRRREKNEKRTKSDMPSGSGKKGTSFKMLRGG